MLPQFPDVQEYNDFNMTLVVVVMMMMMMMKKTAYPALQTNSLSGLRCQSVSGDDP